MSERVEIADAYVALYTKMPGVGKDIAAVLGGPEVSRATEGAAKKQSGIFSGAFGKYLGAAAIAAGVVTAFKGLYEVGSIFDDVSDTIRIGTGATGDALIGLENVAKSVATTIPTSFESAGQTVADLNTRLGLTGDTLTTVASQYLEAGRLLGEEIDIQRTTGLLNAFKVEGEEVSSALDHLFRVSQSTGLGINELSNKAQTAAPLVKNLGISFEETTALVGVLDKSGEPIDKIIASLNAGLVNLAKSGEPMEDAFRRVVGEIDGFVAAGNEAAAFELGTAIFGSRGASAFISAIQSGSLALDDLVGAAGLTGDTILGVAAETNDFAESWQLLKNNALAALEPLGSSVFDALGKSMNALLPHIQKFGPIMAEAFGSFMDILAPIFEQLKPTLSQLLPVLVELWSALSPVSLLFQAIQPVLPQLVSVFTTLAGVMSELAGSVLTVLAPILETVVAVVVELFEAVMPLVPMVLDLVLAFLPLLEPLIELVGVLLPPLIELILFLVTFAIEPLIGALEFLIPIITAVVDSFSQYLIPVIETITNVLGGLIDFLVGVFTGDWEKAWEGIQGIFKGIWDGVQNIAKGAINFIIDLINGVIGAINAVTGPLSDITGGAISLTIPKIPKLAAGAIVTARPGGILANIGEGRYDEVVQPTDGPKFDQFVDKLAGKLNRDETGTLRIDPADIDALGRSFARHMSREQWGAMA